MNYTEGGDLNEQNLILEFESILGRFEIFLRLIAQI